MPARTSARSASGVLLAGPIVHTIRVLTIALPLSRVAPRRVIMIIASLGILAGVTFSSGMMEVARKGIFHPQFFSMPELMVIFLAVMLTDILLLDLAILVTHVLFWRVRVLAGVMLTPYLAWTLFATFLNLEFLRLND